MKPKISRGLIFVTELALFIVSVFAAFWTFDRTTILWNDIVEKSGNLIVRDNYGGMCWQHQGITVLIILFMLFMVVILIWEIVAISDDDAPAPWETVLDERFGIDTSWHDNNNRRSRHHSYDDDGDTENKNNIKMNWKKLIGWAVAIVLVVFLIKLGKTVYKGSVHVYNTSKNYQHEYQQKVEEKAGYYDKLWKTFYEKEQIANLSYEMFREVTIIIMENRRGGENLAWQWLQENQQIPYSEYTKFYTDLSNFIRGQREGYYAIEKECQRIAKENNILLETFPNRLYNKWFAKQENIVFEYGFLSDSTNNVFATGLENIDKR